MSRDAKVGLVIICSFVVLVGTIVAHRFRLTAGQSTANFGEPVVTESDPTTPTSETGSPFTLVETGIPGTTVDATVDDTDSSRDRLATLRDTGLSDHQRPANSSALNRPPTNLPSSRSDGGTISLADGETTGPQRAAVIESGTGGARNRVDSNRRNVRDQDDETPPGRTLPLVDIRSPASKSSRYDTPPRELPSQFGNDDTHESDITVEAKTTEQDEEQTESGETTGTKDDTDWTIDASDVRHDRGGRNATESTHSAESDEDATIVQQAAGKRKPQEPEKPPKLPSFSEQPQATIESVPSRQRPAMDDDDTAGQNALSRSRGSRQVESVPDKSADDNDAPQKVYLVREGDSFWSISAKHYGTGKYFRALEEFNRHRLAAYSDGRTILRPGTEILLPDVSQLRSKSSATRQTNDVAKSEDRETVTPRTTTGRSYERDSLETRSSFGRTTGDRGSRPTTYRVQDGDSLSVIAQRELGTSRRWPEIYELNREKLANERSLTIGMELKLPPYQPPERLVERPIDGR